MASGVVVAQGTLAPLTQVRILARQPFNKPSGLLSDKQSLIPTLRIILTTEL